MTVCPSSPPDPAFVPGLVLAEAYYVEVVEPILNVTCPGLSYTAALIGPGSDVLGFDTLMSTDHGWGPRMQLFLTASDLASRGRTLREQLDQRLPATFRGYPTRFVMPHVGLQGDHRVDIHGIGDYAAHYLGVNVEQPWQPADWLLLPQQKLRSFVGGRVFRDDLGLAALRERLAWYPRDIWLYLLASGWSRVAEDEHLMGRAGFVGDELGSSVIASRLVRDVMRMAFLMERRYAPYAKWLGTAFRQLRAAPALLDTLCDVVHATTWRQREKGLAPAYELLARMHNDLALTAAWSPRVRGFHDRPFRVIRGERFANALKHEIRDDAVRRIAERRLLGNIDFVTDNTDLLEDTARTACLRSLYE